MELRETIIDIAASINRLPHNYKAETIVAILLANGVKDNDLHIQFNGSFNRPFRNDIEKAELYENKTNEELKLHISRNGIYDLLPEGIMHKQIVENGSKETLNHLLNSYKKQKKEESEARLFFKPFENEIFRMLVALEQNEKDLIENNETYFKGFLAKFWSIKSDLSSPQLLFLIKAAPLFSKYKGNLSKISNIIELFIGKPIHFKIEHSEIEISQPKSKKSLTLGINFSIGNKTDKLVFFVLQIYSVPEIEIPNYIDGGQIYCFIMEFLSFLIPIEYEIRIDIIPTFENSNSNGYGILGYTSRLSLN